MIDLTRWANRQLHPIMAELGNEPLIRKVTLLPNLKSVVEFNPAVPLLAKAHLQTLRGERYYRNPGDLMDELLACCKLLAGGPKLYRPDRKIVARPYEFSDVEGYLRAQESKGRRDAEFDLEEPGTIIGLDANEIAIKRAILNLCLFLGHFGTKELGWLHPKDRERHLRKKKRVARAKAFALGDIMQVGLAQEIRVFRYTEDRAEPKGDPAETERKSPRPHYRRGHWAMLNYGHRDRSVRRLKFIRGTRVNWHLFDGNTWENETTFKVSEGEAR